MMAFFLLKLWMVIYMRTILPADTYKVFNRGIFEEDKRKVLMVLYQPIIGYMAVNLYLTLINDLNKNDVESEILTHHHLMTNMQTNLETIVKSREKLEAIGLMKTFYKEDNINNYLYILYSPISAYEFLNHPILNVVLYNNIGKVEYERLVDKFKTLRINTKEYLDVTSSFDSVFASVNGYSIENDNIINDKSRKLEIESNIDINLIISGIPRRMTSEKCFNKETIELIIDLAYLYKIDNLNMQSLVRNSINEKGLINAKELRKSCQDFYKFENNGKLPTLIYNKQPDHLREPLGDSPVAKAIRVFESVSPYDFLKGCYNNAEPTSRDKRIVENLLVDQKLNPGVVNVLIDYVLKTTNNKLNKELVETIAGQWRRMNVETVKEAMMICRKEHNKISKNIKITNKKDKITETKVPDWFLQTEEKNKENIQEFNDILKEFE